MTLFKALTKLAGNLQKSLFKFSLTFKATQTHRKFTPITRNRLSPKNHTCIFPFPHVNNEPPLSSLPFVAETDRFANTYHSWWFSVGFRWTPIIQSLSTFCYSFVVIFVHLDFGKFPLFLQPLQFACSHRHLYETVWPAANGHESS